jgi:hypothetical protein
LVLQDTIDGVEIQVSVEICSYKHVRADKGVLSSFRIFQKFADSDTR